MEFLTSAEVGKKPLGLSTDCTGVVKICHQANEEVNLSGGKISSKKLGQAID